MRPERDPPKAEAVRRLIRCDACGRSEPVSAADVSGYSQGGWPKCCGGVMTYFAESERSRADDTDEMQALPPGT